MCLSGSRYYIRSILLITTIIFQGYIELLGKKHAVAMARALTLVAALIVI